MCELGFSLRETECGLQLVSFPEVALSHVSRSGVWLQEALLRKQPPAKQRTTWWS